MYPLEDLDSQARALYRQASLSDTEQETGVTHWVEKFLLPHNTMKISPFIQPPSHWST